MSVCMKLAIYDYCHEAWIECFKYCLTKANLRKWWLFISEQRLQWFTIYNWVIVQAYRLLRSKYTCNAPFIEDTEYAFLYKMVIQRVRLDFFIDVFIDKVFWISKISVDFSTKLPFLFKHLSWHSTRFRLPFDVPLVRITRLQLLPSPRHLRQSVCYRDTPLSKIE